MIHSKSDVFISKPDILKVSVWIRKGYNAQHCLMAMTEKWRKFLDIGGHVGARLTDPFKAFDCRLPDYMIVALTLTR